MEDLGLAILDAKNAARESDSRGGWLWQSSAFGDERLRRRYPPWQPRVARVAA